MDCRKTLLLAVLGVFTLPAWALTPEELYARLSPSIWFVYGVDPGEKRLSQGSGVVIGPQRVITNCHVLQGASSVFLRKENMIFLAKVEYRDLARDLCQLQVANLTAPAVQVGSTKDLKVGQKVFALGNPKGLEVTLSDGLVSALRGPDGKDPIVQTTAAISQGSSGGGLFNEKGQLVGVTTMQNRSGQNLNFAVPADWVTELPERMKAAEEKKTEQVAAVRASGVAYNPASEGLPPVGAAWQYRYVDNRFSKTLLYNLNVSAVDGWAVHETFSPQDATSSQRERSVAGADEMRFIARRLGAGRTVLEFNPYLLSRGEDAYGKLSGISGYPGSAGNPWKISVKQLGWAEITVPAGTFRAMQFELRGARTQAMNPGMATGDWVGRFLYRIWYAPDARRFVRIRHESWTPSGALNSDDTVELQSVQIN
jgi:serine protease Do